MTGAPDHARPTALVTGGTRGIGAAISHRFLAGGFDVTVTARTEDSFQDFLPTVSGSLRERVSFYAVDFAASESTEVFCERVREMPSLDALVNNAGTNINNPLPALQQEDLEYLDRVNLQGPIRLMQAAVDPMLRTGGGKVVNIASIWSVVTRGGRLAYTATKFGLVGATKAAAVDLADQGILVNAVSPGFTMTELTRRTVTPEDESMLASRVPLSRFADPSEIAGIVFFLCGPENTYITGQNIAVDGGYTIV